MANITMGLVTMGLKTDSAQGTTGTTLQGLMPIHVTYQDILNIFGPPQRNYSEGKIRVEWHGTINNQVFTIYDYKCRDLLLSTLKGEHWHIGGFFERTAQDIIQHTLDKLKEQQQKPDDELTTDNITLQGVFITIVAGDLQLQIECTNESEAKLLRSRLHRFVKSHKVAIKPDAIEAAVEGCIAIKVM